MNGNESVPPEGKEPGHAKADTVSPWWERLNEPKPYAFAALILLGLLLEFVVHYQLGIAVVYTHFYYLIIVIAGLWYGRRAVLIALVFGALHIIDSWFVAGTVSPDAPLRACMFVTIAFVVGIISEQMTRYRDRVLSQNQQLIAVNAELDASQKAFLTANRKLNLLSSITRHDIKNQLVALLGSIELSKKMPMDDDLRRLIDWEEIAANNIHRQIEFTKDYEDIGVRAPVWQDVGERIAALSTLVPPLEIAITVTIRGVKVYADPLLEKVFENMIDNSRRHGGRVRHITFLSELRENNTLALICEDDGTGVPVAEKEKIFEKGFGKHTGLGLFLSREILAITGLTIQECGVPGKGARFEILVPEGKFRFVR